MESDLPLMELAEEDDSLIHSFPDPNQTPSKSSLSFFACSPLLLPPSRTRSLKGSVHIENPSSPSSIASNKENINSNNVEMPKLGMGPMMMKRRKKDEGFNLRKSLAWDRAFFTDEGILDPRELNMITGVNAYTCGRGLPTISEEGNSSFSSRSRCRNETNDIEASNRTTKGNKEKMGYSVGNHDFLPHHKVTHKVLSTDHSNRAGSKLGGYSEAITASSLKRPANSHTLKTAKKESKLPKIPMSKQGSCFSASKGSMTSSQSRHNLIPKPTVNIQKNVGLKSAIKDTHNSQSKAKTGPCSQSLPPKELAQKAVRTLTQSTESTKSQLVQADKLSEIQDESAPLPAKSLAQHTPTTSSNSLPSGLRLPSPSLRFFDQTTASESVSLSNTNTGSNKQNVELRPPAPPARTPMKNIDLTEGRDEANQWTPSPSYMRNTTKGVSDSDIYQETVRKIVPRVDKQQNYGCRGSEQKKRILGHEDKMGNEKISLKGNKEKDECLLHNEEEKLQNYAATTVSTSAQSIQHQEDDYIMKFLQDLGQTSRGQADTEKYDAPPEVNLMSLLEDQASEVIVESQRGKIGKREVDDKRLSFFTSVSHCASTSPESLEENNKENQKHEEMGVIVKNLSGRSDVYECYVKPSNPIVEEHIIIDGCDLQNSNEPQDLVNEPSTSMKATSTTLQVVGGVEGSKISFQEEVEDLKKKKEATMLMERSNGIKRKDNSLAIRPLNAVPFSDEWLAAIEAAGEEILTMKCGAVQHSPPDKSLPEPNPWSPVKNKANQIGPYDCTKYMNAMSSNPD